MDRRRFITSLFRRFREDSAEIKNCSIECQMETSEVHPVLSTEIETIADRAENRQHWINKLGGHIRIQVHLCLNSRGKDHPADPCIDCIKVCDGQAIEFHASSKLPMLNPNNCNNCRECIPVCPSSAIINSKENSTRESNSFDQSGFTLSPHK